MVEFRTLACLLGAAAILAWISPAAAQGREPSTQPDGSIVVDGIREPEKEIAEFARDLTIVRPNSPMAQYQRDKYCPGVTGLDERRNLQIASRMHQVAKAAGVRPATEGACETSALIIFVDDRKEAMDRFKAMHPVYFKELSGEDIIFQGRKSPVVSWKLLARLDRNGDPIGVDAETGIQIVTSYTAMSRLEASSKPAIVMSVVVIEKSAIRGLTVQQVADYAVMRSLTETDPARLDNVKLQTILRVIDTPEGQETPLSLTDWDFAYLKARYDLNEWNYGNRQLRDIRGKIRRHMNGEAQDSDEKQDE